LLSLRLCEKYFFKKHTVASLSVILFITYSLAYSQDSVSYNKRLLFETGGNGGVYSLNFEKDFPKVCSGNLKWEAGFSVVPLGSRIVIDFPLSINYTLGKSRHKAEFGTGQLLIINIGSGNAGFIRGTLHIGYRNQLPQKRWFWKIAYTPFYSYAVNFQYEHWLGAGVGYQIRN
jgi:hypothetical protein